MRNGALATGCDASGWWWCRKAPLIGGGKALGSVSHPSGHEGCRCPSGLSKNAGLPYRLALVKPKTTMTHYARIKRDAKKTHPDVRKFLAPVAQMSRTSTAYRPADPGYPSA